MPSMYKARSPSYVMAVIDADYDYSATLEGEDGLRSEGIENSPPPHPEPEDDLLLDLAQLEQLHQEADRMKGLGNKHMANQNYWRAYNAYSAALQLSPIGPSSHVFLSNRSASLLSMKKYTNAAADARRAIALAPTCGKAYARLGQSLYFLKDYRGAIAAYQEAIHYEPDNTVTKTYLKKAQTKLMKQLSREELSTTAETSTFVASTNGADSLAESAIVTRSVRSSTPRLITQTVQDDQVEEDPDFDEAVRIQQQANQFLAQKQYKFAIEEYSSALFLVPDDPYLSPELHLGRAHAFNGCRRHESALNDAKLALKLQVTPEAYSTLAKCHFYLRDYGAAVEAYENCEKVLPEGEALNDFDQKYFDKARAFELETSGDDTKSVFTTRSHKSIVPKLPPPRFVPREKALRATPTMPSMPKHWPQQSPNAPLTMKVGPERSVVFLSESMGIKLNRGFDGWVRVLSVVPETPLSPIVREGMIEAGDVVREAAEVDIRRPITNVMWGDTVALIKMAPRPITLVVAKELSKVPNFVFEERGRVEKQSARLPASVYIQQERREIR